jgi:hypothetical protein
VPARNEAPSPLCIRVDSEFGEVLGASFDENRGLEGVFSADG